MADISTAVSMARVPILGENGRISDDYVPAAIGESTAKAEAAATRAETAATSAEGSATAASQSATQASGSASAASTSAAKAQESAATAGGAATQAQSAQQAAEAAKTAAETAQSAAADSAQDAQQSATAAASSAASVADKFIASAQATTLEPGSQATASVEEQVLNVGIPKGDRGDKGDPGHTPQRGVDYWTAEDVEAIVEDAKTQAVAELAEIGNVPKRTVSDLVAHGEDAYAQKPIEVRVKGKTWVNRWPVLNAKVNGITVSTDETGLVTLTGELTTPASGSYVSIGVNGISTNKSITALCSRGLPDGVYLYVIFRDSDNTPLPGELQVGFSSTTETQKSATVPANTASILAGVSVKPGTVLNGSLSFRVMLVDGTEAPDCFTPPASITSAQPENLVTAGKNLLSSSTFAGESSNRGVLNFSLPAGTYTLSCYNAEDWWTDNDNVSTWYIHDADNNFVVNAIMGSPSVGSRSSATFTLPRAGDFTLYTYKMGIAEMVTDIQLELGSTATAYEPPTVTETPLPEVELRSLPNGTCDELVIKADGTCEVERRTQLVDGEVVALDSPITEPQSPVSLPQLPAPTFNAWHDSDVPSDTTVTYERDINIVLDNLAKQVAGTASAVAVREASTIEEE